VSTKDFNNPFDALKALRATMPDAPAEPSIAPAPAAASAPTARPVPRAVVRMERAGRGGKEVTVVDHLALPARDLDTWLKALKGQLGCGGVIEGERLVLQGDHRKRLPALLERRGVKKVVIG
jgi:translation initiation factor 1